MTESKHTPGPWEIRYWSEDDGTVLGITNESLRREIATCGPAPKHTESESGWALTYGSNTANARLIAEAGTVASETGLTPRQLADQRKELLSALRLAESILNDYSQVDASGRTWGLEDNKAFIKAAIAKAEGR